MIIIEAMKSPLLLLMQRREQGIIGDGNLQVHPQDTTCAALNSSKSSDCLGVRLGVSRS